MEKSHTDFLQECKNEIAALKERLSALEERLSEILPDDEPVDWDGSVEEFPVEEEVDALAGEVDFTDIEIGVAETEPVSEPEAVSAPEPAPAPEPVVEEPEPVPEPEPAPAPVPDDTAHLPWRKDKPGLPVKNIRSGISLVDRALFINSLFKEDYTLYDSTIAELNEVENLDQAVAYVKAHFPDWDLSSDGVYRFMMALRKKLG